MLSGKIEGNWDFNGIVICGTHQPWNYPLNTKIIDHIIELIFTVRLLLQKAF